jgi:hypothetical protein
MEAVSASSVWKEKNSIGITLVYRISEYHLRSECICMNMCILSHVLAALHGHCIQPSSTPISITETNVWNSNDVFCRARCRSSIESAPVSVSIQIHWCFWEAYLALQACVTDACHPGYIKLWFYLTFSPESGCSRLYLLPCWDGFQDRFCTPLRVRLKRSW